MELKNYFTQDITGNIIPGAMCYLYTTNTTSLVNPIYDKNGTAMTNPVATDLTGRLQIKMPNGTYDLKVVAAGRSYTMTIQFNDVSESVAAATTAATASGTSATLSDASAVKAKASADKAELYALAAVYSTIQPTAGANLIIGADGVTVIRATLVQATTTITLGGTIPAGQSRQFTIILNQGVGARKVTWDPTIRWADGRVPTLSFDPGSEDVISVLQVGGLAFCYGFFNGGSFA